MLTSQSMLLILITILIITSLPFYGRFFFFLKKNSLLFRKKKSNLFSFFLKFIIISIVIIFILKYYNNDNILKPIILTSPKPKLNSVNYISIYVAIIGSCLGVIQFNKNNRTTKLNNQLTYFYKLIDILKNELSSSEFETNKISSKLDEYSDKILLLRKNTNNKNNAFVNYVIFRTRTKKNNCINNFYYNYFKMKIKIYLIIHRVNDKDLNKNLNNLLNVIYTGGSIQVSNAICFPNKKQYRTMYQLCYKIINSSPEYNSYKKFFPTFFNRPPKESFDNAYKIMKCVGFLDYIKSFFPEKDYFIYSYQYSYIPTFFAINKFVNSPDNSQMNKLCRYIHRLIKEINHMAISVDEKYSYYGLVRSLIDSKLLTLIYLNATFSYKGSGLAKQLIGTCFFGSTSEIKETSNNHIDISMLPSNSDRRLCKEILINYYAGYIYPGNINKKKVLYTMMIKVADSYKNKHKIY